MEYLKNFCREYVEKLKETCGNSHAGMSTYESGMKKKKKPSVDKKYLKKDIE